MIFRQLIESAALLAPIISVIGVSVEGMHGTCNEYALTIVTGEVGFGGRGSASNWFDKGGKEIGGGVLNLWIKYTIATFRTRITGRLKQTEP